MTGHRAPLRAFPPRPASVPSSRLCVPVAGRLVLLLLGLLLLACTQPPAALPPVPPATPSPRPTAQGADGLRLGAVTLPADEAPHDCLTEWWYYTGHLLTPTGRRFGFQFVVFQAIRGQAPVGYAAHAAVTDGAAQRFVYAERSARARRPQRSGGPGFDLRVADWHMRGLEGQDALSFAVDRYRLQLDLHALKPPVAHAGGLISFGVAGESYYYSRTRMAAHGTLEMAGQRTPVTGQAWFDKQWGDFLVFAQGGWDWFALQLDDGSDLMLSLVRDASQTVRLAYGTVVDPAGRATHLRAEQFHVEVLGRWPSPRRGAIYPSGWRIVVPAAELDVRVTPVLLDQEFVAEEAAGLTYWEGQSLVRGTRGGQPIGGLAYVELTGYAP